MVEVWKDCGEGYEAMWRKESTGEWSREQADAWFESHCKICPYFSGYHCAEGEI